MACGAHRSASFQSWGVERLLKQDVARKTKLKPAVVRIGVKTRWAHSPEFIAANMRKFEVIEKREREVNEFVGKIIQERREEKPRELLSPYQLNTISHPALTVAQERLLADSIQQRSSKLSSSPLSTDWKFPRKVRHQAECAEEKTSKDSSCTSRSWSPSSSSLTVAESYSSQDLGSPSSSNKILYSTESLIESPRQSEEKEKNRELCEQYLALMEAVSGPKPKRREKMEPEKALYIGALREALCNLKSNLQEHSQKILLPEDELFDDYFSFETSCPWMAVEFKEITTLPDCLINNVSDVDHSESAAFLRMAAWDHYFFEHSKPGTKFPSPFCKFEEGETPADKFLYPSRPVRDFNMVSCFWKPLTDTKVLKYFMKFVKRGNHNMEIPPYLVECGYVKNTRQSMIKPSRNLKTVREKSNSAYYGVVRHTKELREYVSPT